MAGLIYFYLPNDNCLVTKEANINKGRMRNELRAVLARMPRPKQKRAAKVLVEVGLTFLASSSIGAGSPPQLSRRSLPRN